MWDRGESEAILLPIFLVGSSSLQINLMKYQHLTVVRSKYKTCLLARHGMTCPLKDLEIKSVKQSETARCLKFCFEAYINPPI